ncbi:MAG: ArsA-related P-loop ATPase [Pseudomonadales bacterium]
MSCAVVAIDLVRLIAEHRVVVCCGAGGVGKTTSAAALGMLAARHGRRVLVMTIDPAKRLAQAMGLHDLDNDPQPVAVDAPGALSAMMLDTKRTFDQMIETYAPSERVRDTIFENSYYQQLSSSLGGSRELIAMERVLEIISADDFDLLIVDTPPAQHALDFLDAPQRLIDLLDGSLTKLLIAPYGVAARAQFNFFRQSSAVALKFMERFTGVEMLADLSNFLLAFSSMFDGLKLRSEKVMALMNESTTSFLLICAPEPISLGQVNQFTERLEREQIAIAGVLVNRVHPAVSEEPLTSDDIRLLDAVPCDPSAGRGLSQRVTDAFVEAQNLAAADERALASLRLSAHSSLSVPHFNRDLHSLDDLAEFAEILAGR